MVDDHEVSEYVRLVIRDVSRAVEVQESRIGSGQKTRLGSTIVLAAPAVITVVEALGIKRLPAGVGRFRAPSRARVFVEQLHGPVDEMEEGVVEHSPLLGLIIDLIGVVDG